MGRRQFMMSSAAATGAMAFAGSASTGDQKSEAMEVDQILGDIGKANKYNLIVIMLDTLRKDHVGAYGNQWIKTPNLNKLASESIIFNLAFPESLPTIPVRRGLHTGMRTFPFRSYQPVKGDNVRTPGWQPIPEGQITLAEILNYAGYRTAFITDTNHQFKPAMNFHRGFDQFTWIRGQESDKFSSVTPLPESEVEKYVSTQGGSRSVQWLAMYMARWQHRTLEEEYMSPRVFTAAMRWLEQNRDAERFFLLVDSFDPHEPWDPPYYYRDLYYPGYKGREVIVPRYGSSDYLTPDELKYMRACYAAEVTMVDMWLGKFIDRAKQLGMLDETLLFLISDHGHQLGEHGLVGKVPRGLYPELMDIPLFLRHPDGSGKGTLVDIFAQNHDIPPTALSLLGLKQPLKMDGMDLWPLISGDSGNPRSYVTSGHSNAAWYRDEEYVLLCTWQGENPELYDLRKDPRQQNNIADSNKALVKKLFSRIIADAGGPFPDYTRLLKDRSERWYLH